MNGHIYATYDIVLATYLIAGEVCKLTDIASNGDGRKLFCFDPAPSKEQLIAFYAGSAQVSAGSLPRRTRRSRGQATRSSSSRDRLNAR